MPTPSLELNQSDIALAAQTVTPDDDNDRAFFRRNMLHISKYIDGRMSSWSFFDLRRPRPLRERINAIEHPDGYQSRVDPLLAGLWEELESNRTIWNHLKNGFVGRVEELVGKKALKTKLYGPLEMPYHIGCSVNYIEKTSLVTFSVLRDREQGDFTEEEIETLKMLRPYLIGIYEGWLRHAWEHRYMNRFASSLGHALIITDAYGAIRASTERAKKLLSDFFPPLGTPRNPQLLPGLLSAGLLEQNGPQLRAWQFKRKGDLLHIHSVRIDEHFVLMLFPDTVYGFKKRCGRETDKQEDYEFTISRKLLNILKERCKGKDFLEISGDAEKEFDKLKGEKFGLSSRDDLSNWYAAIGQLVHPKRGALNIWMAGVIDTGKGQPQE